MEQLDYNLLFRWFIGLSIDDKVWDHSVFSKKLGLKPHYLDIPTLQEMLLLVQKYRDRIDTSLILPQVKSEITSIC